ncbi:MAG: SCO family protein [Gammaproteobacteria bacterium AqS3]|nr:SCO family protein [Gammaproteobacteria bacterium AqS3]
MSLKISKTAQYALMIAAFVLGVMALTVWRMQQFQVLNSEELRDYGVVLVPEHRSVRPFELLDHSGEPFTQDSFRGAWTLVFFGFTHCPDICPLALGSLAVKWDEVQQGIGADQTLRAAMVTVDPGRDTVERLAGYVPAFNPDFTGITGDIATIYNLSVDLASPFMPVAPEDAVGRYNVEHAIHYSIVNPCGHYVGFLRNPVDVKTLPRAMASLVHQPRGC